MHISQEKERMEGIVAMVERLQWIMKRMNSL